MRSNEQIFEQCHIRRLWNRLRRPGKGNSFFAFHRSPPESQPLQNKLYTCQYCDLTTAFKNSIQVIEGRVHTEIDASGAAEALRNAEKIVIVPGYGLAVAQAAGVVSEIALKLRKEGKDVKFAVHPVVSSYDKSNFTTCEGGNLYSYR